MPKGSMSRIGDWSASQFTPPAPPRPVSATDRSVVVEGDKTIAYMDRHGQPAMPELAAAAKVWEMANGELTMKVVDLTPDDLTDNPAFLGGPTRPVSALTDWTPETITITKRGGQ